MNYSEILEGLLFLSGDDGISAGEIKKILELDRMLTVQTIAKETRNGSKLIASRMIKLFLDLYEM